MLREKFIAFKYLYKHQLAKLLFKSQKIRSKLIPEKQKKITMYIRQHITNQVRQRTAMTYRHTSKTHSGSKRRLGIYQEQEQTADTVQIPEP